MTATGPDPFCGPLGGGPFFCLLEYEPRTCQKSIWLGFYRSFGVIRVMMACGKFGSASKRLPVRARSFPLNFTQASTVRDHSNRKAIGWLDGLGTIA